MVGGELAVEGGVDAVGGVAAEEVEGEDLFGFDVGDENGSEDEEAQQEEDALLFVLGEG